MEKVEQRLKDADCKIQNLDNHLQVAQEARQAELNRAEDALRESREKYAKIAVLERRLKLNGGNIHR